MSSIIIGIGIFLLFAAMLTGGYLLYKRSKQCSLDCGLHGTLNASNCSCVCAPSWEGPNCTTPTPLTFAEMLEKEGLLQPDATGGCPAGYGTVEYKTPGGLLTMCDPNAAPNIVVTVTPPAPTSPIAPTSPAPTSSACPSTPVTCGAAIIDAATKVLKDETGASAIEIRDVSAVEPNICDIAVTLYPSGRWEKRRITYGRGADCGWQVATIGGPLSGQTVDVGIAYDWN